MKYPRIYLTLDNCFAIKRWVKPQEWLELIQEIGFEYVQASTDNEIDPLFSTPEYMDDWFEEVAKYSKKTGVKLSGFYTGYQTYRTVGLAHHDRRIVEHLKHNWINNLSKRCGAHPDADGFGFSFFAIPETVMQDPAKHKEVMDGIFADLYDIADYAYENGRVKVSVEQMYVPYQPPFTMEDSAYFLKRVYQHKQRPIYLTLDTGHMVGQHKFFRPSKKEILKSFSEDSPNLWFGGDSVLELWKQYKKANDFEKGCQAIEAEMDKYPYMFATPEDCDPYIWFERLAKYSPIVHMQQTCGKKSAHAPFTPETNKNGIITGEKLLAAIKKSYDDPEEIQPPVEDIYLAFEIFASNTDKKPDIIKGLKQTLEYWRQFIPKDGMRLDELI